jgi:phage-related tail protein
MSDLGQMATATAAGPLEAMLEKYEKMNAGLSPVQEDMAALAHIMNILSEEGSAAGVNLEYIAMLYKRIREEMDKAEVTKKNAEIKSSFESIGNAVSDAFKGMLTGAASFKDGMKSIINSVIDELWKLYVVKQIVGFFTDTVMPAIGIKLPKFANGTMNAPGGLALVGERGPELVNLPKGSQVIPNHKMKGGIGGGINITVDARGSSDPAAVRAQVQQGILEAAPAIIAAAEARTTRGLRRPRLAGVMQ